MASRIGMPSVARVCLEGSGLFLSRPPGIFSQATTPHMLPLHWATRMLATPSATCQSPVGSAASAGLKPATKVNPDKTIVRADNLRQCNMVRTYALVGWLGVGVKTPHSAFSVDEAGINRSK